ncbi:hypothetical protein FHX49_000606 [Microbacterium endophyticum]|uniref:Uncharacterized protein n=1 Tax=Microbacterium endophyticum TaxID=1526412 RepID=A0A7W4V2E7_9MICO|nr:hypothetical protein [Microbacterium endophyticum]MBB2975065.1 hypothetical protein [Microbacterium endophyticum]NIK37395.1 hypothetical protein [Microbacterium endophyticum]
MLEKSPHSTARRAFEVLRRVFWASGSVLVAVVASKWLLFVSAGLFMGDGGMLGLFFTEPFGLLVVAPIAIASRSRSAFRSAAWAALLYIAFVLACVYVDWQLDPDGAWTQLNWVQVVIGLAVTVLLASGLGHSAVARPPSVPLICLACVLAAVYGLCAGFVFQSAVWLIGLAVVLLIRARHR